MPNFKVDDVCLYNGLNYYYFDSSYSNYVTDAAITQDLPHLYILKPLLESQMFEKYLFRPSTRPTGPNANTAIANQTEYPLYLLIKKYKGFCSIVAKNLIQWQNIFIQLAIPSVNFRKTETGCIMLQAIYQAGPSDYRKTTLRQNYLILYCADFCAQLMAQLRLAIRRIKQNWESALTLVIFISATTRIFSFCDDTQI